MAVATEQSHNTSSLTRLERPLGIGLFAVGGVCTFLMMANESHLYRGPLWGICTTLITVFGLLLALRMFSDKDRQSISLPETVFAQLEGEPHWMIPKYWATAAVCILLLGTVLGGYPFLPYTLAAFLAALIPPALRRPGLAVFIIVSALYLPLLGTFGLWDPWETHYGEVAREVLARDDWISLWWAQEDWFWSKPILIFWLEALTLGALGVPFAPDANPSNPEWALRLPIYLIAITACLAVYSAVSRLFGRRAGVLSALVLATVPYFFFLSHQAITDMPFVGSMTVAMSLFMLALTEDDERKVQSYRVGPFTFSFQHLVMGTIALASVPQALYLLSRNVTLVKTFQFAWHQDEFAFGSAGNGEVPGNKPNYIAHPVFDDLWHQPAAQALLWFAGLAFILWRLKREQRAQALYMFGFYFFCALAFMGKGIPGFALPGVVALFYLVASRRWSLLTDGKFRVAAGMAVVAVVGMPWYVAMYVRHGAAFTDRLLVHDHINRLAAGVHGDTGSIQYFIGQLGYGLFPWAALIPAALWKWLHIESTETTDTEEPHSESQKQAILLIGIWFIVAFVLFSAMITKFHHYIFPATPAIAILVGILLHQLFGNDHEKSLLGTIAAVAASACLILGIAGLWGDPAGFVPPDVTTDEKTDWVLRHRWNPVFAGLLTLTGASLAALAYRWTRDAQNEEQKKHSFLAALLISGALIVAFVGRDLSWVTGAQPEGYERLIDLFVYNYTRPWPEHIDYRPILTAFGVVATVLALLCASARFRALASRMLLGAALCFSAWCLNIYLPDLSPHWGQRELVKRYYQERKDASEPLVAWQMNWKGENFYTGNRVSVFMDLDNRKVQEWIAAHSRSRSFFVLEHSRLGSLKGLFPARKVREISTLRDNNKFVLVEVPPGQ